MLKLFYSTSSAGGFFSPTAHKKAAPESSPGFQGRTQGIRKEILPPG